MKRIIIIGGMGPQASIEMHRRLMLRAVENDARDGGDFPHVVHFSLPVDDFISDTEKTAEALAFIVDELSGFQFRRDDVVILACNTAHLLQNQIERRLGITITSLIDATVAYVVENHKTIALLASPTTIRTGLYTKQLQARGIQVMQPSESQVLRVESAIRSVIASEKPEPLRKTNLATLLGCTELSCVFGNEPNVIDPMNIVIDKILPRTEVL